MEIKDLLKKELMIMNLKSSKKEEVIDEMIDRLYDKKIISNKEIFKNEIMNREKQFSTGLGQGIAMPHAKVNVVNMASVLFAKSDSGIDYDSLDGKSSHIFFMIAAPEGANDTHIEILARLSKILLRNGLIDKLKFAYTPDEIHEIITEEKESRTIEYIL